MKKVFALSPTPPSPTSKTFQKRITKDLFAFELYLKYQKKASKCFKHSKSLFDIVGSSKEIIK